MENFTKFFSTPDSNADNPQSAYQQTTRIDEIIDSLYQSGFLKQHFQKQSIYLQGKGERGIPFSLEQLRKILPGPGKTVPQGFSLEATFRSNLEDRLFPIQRIHVGPLLDAGATICATNVHLLDKNINYVVQVIKEKFKYSGVIGVNCYISPDGAGFRMHFDSKTALIFQIEGAKNWTFSVEPEIEFPRRAARFVEDHLELAHPNLDQETWEVVERPNVEDFKRIRLSAGDILHFPAGAWHEAQADGYSLALTFAFQASNFSLFVLPLIAEELRKISHWRSGPPPAQGGAEDTTQEQVEKYIQDRIDELQQVVRELRPNDPRLMKMWKSSFAQSL